MCESEREDDMQKYRLFDRSVEPGDQDFEMLLSRAHGERTRVMCECQSDCDLALYEVIALNAPQTTLAVNILRTSSQSCREPLA